MNTNNKCILIFLPMNIKIQVNSDTKILAAAKNNNVPIRSGCGAGQCGTCAVKVDITQGKLSEMKAKEKDLLCRMNLPLDGSVRLSCQTRILEGICVVDLDFQKLYSPDVGMLNK